MRSLDFEAVVKKVECPREEFASIFRQPLSLARERAVAATVRLSADLIEGSE